MVGGKLPQGLVAEAVHAAVARVEHEFPGAVSENTGEGRTHIGKFGRCGSLVPHFRLDCLKPFLDGSDEPAGCQVGRKSIKKCIE